MATHLDIILYSRQQIELENQQTQQHKSHTDTTVHSDRSDNVYSTGQWEWGIISIKAQLGDTELPMLPITIMRNALISEGGSGVEIDRVMG